MKKFQSPTSAEPAQSNLGVFMKKTFLFQSPTSAEPAQSLD